MRQGKFVVVLATLVLGPNEWLVAQDVTVGGGVNTGPANSYGVGASGGSAASPGAPPPGTATAAVSGAYCLPSGPIVITPTAPGWYWVPGPYGPVPYIPPTFVIAPGGGFGPIPPPVVGVPPIAPPMGFGVNPGPVPAALAADAMVQRQLRRTARRQVAASRNTARQRDPERAELLVTVGDRLFRAENRNRAVERYQQAIEADPSDADPRLRLAQVAVARGNYAEAANRLREAEAAEPGWLLNHPFDVQGLYGEPSDFAAMIAEIESHLTAHPDDRDAWLVLGAELFLSGRTDRSANVFLRLTDRKPGPTLAAFLDASRALE